MSHKTASRWLPLVAAFGVAWTGLAAAQSQPQPQPQQTQPPAQIPAMPPVGTQAAPVAPGQAPQTAALPASFRELAAGKLPAVVNVSTTQRLPQRGQMGPELPPDLPFRDFFDEFFGNGDQPNRPREMHALGSGFIIDPQGYVVTNNHVIADADEIKVILHDDTEMDAQVVGRDSRTDLALLKIESSRPLPYVQWGNSDEAQVGDWVLAIGNPFGLGGSVTAGIISARARDIQAGPYDDFIQTDAAINRGNSGGPMFDMKGLVIGVNTAIFSPTGGNIGIGFAVPSAAAQTVIQSLRDTGTVRRGWLGVAIQRLDEPLAKALGLQSPQGALVTDTVDDGPAAKAGLQAGDVILAFNGQPIDDVRELQRLVANAPIDQQARMEVWREGRRVTVTPQIALLREPQTQVAANGRSNQPPQGATSALGLALTELTPELRRQFDISPDTQGVLVAGVADNSAAADQGLQPGDVIARVGRQEVSRPDQVVQAIEQARSNNQETVLVLRERDGNPQFVPLPVEKKQG